MTQVIYIPIMIVSKYYRSDFYYELAENMLSFRTPESVKIVGVRGQHDALLAHLFEEVEKRNPDGEDMSEIIVKDRYNLIRIDIETESPIKIAEMPWLEEQIKEEVRKFEASVGIYFFYLIDSGTRFKSCNMLKVFTAEGVTIIEDESSDDMSPLQDAASYLYHLWYEPDGKTAFQVFVAESAKYLLILED